MTFTPPSAWDVLDHAQDVGCPRHTYATAAGCLWLRTTRRRGSLITCRCHETMEASHG